MAKKIMLPDQNNKFFDESEYYSEDEKEFLKELNEAKILVNDNVGLNSFLKIFQYENFDFQTLERFLLVSKEINKRYEHNFFMEDQRNDINKLYNDILKVQSTQIDKINHLQVNRIELLLNFLNESQYFEISKNLSDSIYQQLKDRTQIIEEEFQKRLKEPKKTINQVKQKKYSKLIIDFDDQLILKI